jgi:hypothetical protein
MRYASKCGIPLYSILPPFFSLLLGVQESNRSSSKQIYFIPGQVSCKCNSNQSLKILIETWIAVVFEIRTGRVQKLGVCTGERFSCWWRCRLYYRQSPTSWQSCCLHLLSRSHMKWNTQEVVELELHPSSMKEMDNFSMSKSSIVWDLQELICVWSSDFQMSLFYLKVETVGFLRVSGHLYYDVMASGAQTFPQSRSCRKY